MRKNKIYIYLVIGFVLMFSLILLYFYNSYLSTKQRIIDQSIEEASHQLSFTELEYLEVRKQILSLTELLQQSETISDYFQSPDYTNEQKLTSVWKAASHAKPWLEDVTLLTAGGEEILKVSGIGEAAQSVPMVTLLNRSQSDYFVYMSKQVHGKATVWGVDLREENGEIIRPLEPVLRFIAPITYNSNQTGYLIVSVDMWELIRRINYSPIEGVHPEIIDMEGFFFTSLNKELLFGNVLDERKHHNFSVMFPESWEIMHQISRGSHFENNYLIVFENVEFTEGQDIFSVIRLSNDQINLRTKGALATVIWRGTIVVLGLLVLMLPMSGLAYQATQRSIDSKLARAALSGMSAVLISDSENRVIRINQEFEKITGFNSHQIEGQNAHHIVSPIYGEDAIKKHIKLLEVEGVWQGELKVTRADGELFDAIVREQLIVEDSGEKFFVVSLMDMTKQKELEAKLRNLSERDSLTKLWNRRKFDLELHRFTKLVQRYPELQSYCLVLVDIDHFKSINDKYGHDEGDRVLQFVATFLKDELRNTDFVARVGGEEFAILMPHAKLDEIKIVLDRVRVALSEKAGNQVTVSMGATDLTSDPEKSYKRADVALYKSKTDGRDRVTTLSSDEYTSS